MKKLFIEIENCKKRFPKKANHEIANEFCKKYPNVPMDIMEFYFVKHSNQGLETLTDIPDLKAVDIKVSKVKFSNNNLLDKNMIENAPFTHYHRQLVTDELANSCMEWYKNNYFVKGTWDYPIVTIRNKKKYWVIDGTNRFRHMLFCLDCKYDFIANEHMVYVLNN